MFEIPFVKINTFLTFDYLKWVFVESLNDML